MKKKRLQWSFFFLLSPDRAKLPCRTAEVAAARAAALGMTERAMMLGLVRRATVRDTRARGGSVQWVARALVEQLSHDREEEEGKKKCTNKCVISGMVDNFFQLQESLSLHSILEVLGMKSMDLRTGS